MTHEFLVLHFGTQCPWQPWVVEQAHHAASAIGASVRVADAADHTHLSQRFRLFFPFMTVIDERIRVPSPMPAARLAHVAVEGLAPRQATPLSQAPPGKAETVGPLGAEEIVRSCPLCVPPGEERGCAAKSAWAARMASRVRDGILGFGAYVGGTLVGAVEFLPSPRVPYPLPAKSVEAAFITCLYSTEDGPDYRTELLDHLIAHLEMSGVREVLVVAGRNLPYPNGPASFFDRHGFGIVEEVDQVRLEEGDDTLVLLRRRLGSPRRHKEALAGYEVGEKRQLGRTHGRRRGTIAPGCLQPLLAKGVCLVNWATVSPSCRPLKPDEARSRRCIHA